MRPFRKILLTVTAVLASFPAMADQEAVLFTSRGCNVDEFSMLEVRKAFLGISVEKTGHPVSAFRYVADPVLNDVFLQSVVNMTRRTYERRLLSMLVKYGNPRPPEHEEFDKLVAAIVDQGCGLSLGWRDNVEREPELRIIRTVWRRK